MVSVPKTNPIPQLSIVVPVHGDAAAFESTLISVLENQPAASEVIVSHDGSYDDPFDLGEEVRFVSADSGKYRDLVSTAAHQARGRFVHLLSDGLQATEGWTEHAVHALDHFDTAAVAPVIRSKHDQKIMAAGWSNGIARLGKPSTKLPLKSKQATQVVGAYLQASFWRRDVLRSLSAAFDGHEVFEASMVYHYLLRKAGWRTDLVADSSVLCEFESLPWERVSLRRGMRLAAIRNHFAGMTSTQNLLSAGLACLSNLTSPSMLIEALGQSLAPLSKDLKRQIHLDAVLTCDDQGMIVLMPRHGADTNRYAA